MCGVGSLELEVGGIVGRLAGGGLLRRTHTTGGPLPLAACPAIGRLCVPRVKKTPTIFGVAQMVGLHAGHYPNDPSTYILFLNRTIQTGTKC